MPGFTRIHDLCATQPQWLLCPIDQGQGAQLASAGGAPQKFAAQTVAGHWLMHSLPLFVRLKGRNVILAGSGEAADAKRRLLERAGAVVCDESGAAQLAIVAVDDEEEALATVDRLRARNILVNAVDRPDLCDFTLPSILDRDPVIIAIGTGGASAGLAKALRQRLELIFPANLGKLAIGLNAARARFRARLPDPSERRRAIDAALQPGGPLDPLLSESADRVADWMGEEGTVSAQAVIIKLISDDPDDLRISEARALAGADLVIHAPNVPAAIRARARADAAQKPGVSLPDPLPPGLTVLILI